MHIKCFWTQPVESLVVHKISIVHTEKKYAAIFKAGKHLCYNPGQKKLGHTISAWYRMSLKSCYAVK